MASSELRTIAAEATLDYNRDNGTEWNFGSNWDGTKTEFKTFLNNYLFPKIAQTTLAQQNLGNRFDFLAKEVNDETAVLREDYVIADSVPAELNLSKPREDMLKANYPKMMTKLYTAGQYLKEKFTINLNQATWNFQTLGDGIDWVLAVYSKRISDINMYEEKMIKAMLVDYSLNVVKEQRTVTSHDDLVNEIEVALLNMQNNSDEFNEASLAQGDPNLTYSTYTPLKDVFILTDDRTKAFLLNSILANTFQVAGIDISDRIISFSNLGGSYRLTDDVTLTADESKLFKSAGWYQAETGDVIYKGTVLTFDITDSKAYPSFAGKFEEIKPQTDMYASIWDINSVGYKRKTSGMVSDPFPNPEYGEVTHWLFYYAQRYVRAFFNHITITGKA